MTWHMYVVRALHRCCVHVCLKVVPRSAQGAAAAVCSRLLRLGRVCCPLPGLLHDLAVCDVVCALLCRGPKQRVGGTCT